jgi:excisionase family DNA binding protein
MKTKLVSERLYTVGEAAEALGVCPTTVNRWCRSKKIVSIRTLGGHHRIKESVVQAILNPPE